MLLPGLLLLSTSGCCFTQMVWSEDDDEAEEVRVEWVRAERECAIDCQFVPNVDGGELDLRVADASSYRLRAEPASQSIVWLAAGPLLQAPSVEVELDLDHEDGHPLFGAARVLLRGTLLPAAVGVEIDAASLPASVRTGLDAAVAEQPGFAFGRDPAASDAPLVRRCRERLRELDLAPLLGSPPPRPVLALGVVFTTADGQPWVPTPAVPPVDGAPAPVEAPALEQLAGIRAQVRAGDGERRYTFALAMDRAWLWSELERSADGLVQLASSWSVVEGAGASPAAGTTIAGRLRLRERDITWQTRTSDTSFVEKLAWTPFALAGDVLVGWLLQCLDVPWCGCDDDDEHDAADRERRRNEQHARQQARRR